MCLNLIFYMPSVGGHDRLDVPPEGLAHVDDVLLKLGGLLLVARALESTYIWVKDNASLPFHFAPDALIG